VRALAVAAVALAAGSAAPTPAQVVRAWSKALNADENVAAGALFAPNARVVQGPLDVRLRTRALAVEFNAALPCSGKILELRVSGDRVTATFMLGERPRHRCDAPGTKAAALFEIRNGKIVLWKQIPVPTGVPA
jgi:limonene-1,2-epoxide hydrolase